MRRRVRVDLRASTQARANGHRDAAINALSGRNVAFRDLDPTTLNTDVGWAAHMDIRFASDAEADAVFNAVMSRLQTNGQVETGSFIDWHDCTHDDPVPQPCVIGGRANR